jgi:hypothetical protein
MLVIKNNVCKYCMCYMIDHNRIFKKCIGCGFTKEKELKTVGIQIDWNDPESNISTHFKVKEALNLPSWNTLHIPSNQEKINILKQAAIMDVIREFLNTSINVHCWIRPILNNPGSVHNGEDYNALVGGATHSAHILGIATDFDVTGMICDDVRSKLEPMLEQWNIRMEYNPGSNWVHIDCQTPPIGGHRYFKP